MNKRNLKLIDCESPPSDPKHLGAGERLHLLPGGDLHGQAPGHHAPHGPQTGALGESGALGGAGGERGTPALHLNEPADVLLA